MINGKHVQGTHSTKMGADILAENIPNGRKFSAQARDSRWMSYEPAAILNQNLPYIPHIIG